MQLKTQGLIIKEQAIGESDRLVTVLTREHGVLRAFARRAKKLSDSKNAATQLLCYSRLNIYQGREKYIINDAFPLEVFFDLRRDIARLSLAQYFCELAAELAPEGVDSAESLRVVLNALHFLCKEARPRAMLKSIIELRLLAFAGYMPNLICCDDCGVYEADTMYFHIGRGLICCKNCFVKTEEAVVALNRAAMRAMRHIVFSDFEKLFSFQLSEGAQKQLSAATEAYMCSVVQKRMKTLDFYYSVC